MFDLTGKRALVTGATGSIGGGIARALHGQGAIVGLSGTRREALDALAAELGERCAVLPCDLADGAAVDELVPQAEAAIGDLDILVNNAGLTRDTLFVRMSDEDWDKVITVNLTAAFKLSRAVLMGMMRRRSGRVISISSVVAVDRQCRAGQLRRLEGRPDRHDQGARPGGRKPRRHGELYRAGVRRLGDDRRPERQAERIDPAARADAAAGHSRRDRFRGGLSGQR